MLRRIFSFLLVLLLVISYMPAPTFAVEAVESTESEATSNEEYQQICVTGVELDKSNIQLSIGGEAASLTATIVPQDATNQEITWTSSDPTIVTVVNGIITPVACGEVTVSATTVDGGFTSSCQVAVMDADDSEPNKEAEITEITLNQTDLEITVGDSATLTTIVYPENATVQTIVWESSNTSVATVADGIVTPVSMGTASITARTENGEVSATCNLTVWGVCGESAKWFVSGTTLIIDGSGAINDCTSAAKQPWPTTTRSKITTLELGDNITRIGNYAFSTFVKLETLTISSGSLLESIGKNAFQNTSRLKIINLPSSITALDSGSGIKSKEIHFQGTAEQWEALGCDATNVYVLDENGTEVKYEVDLNSGKCGDYATWTFNSDTEILTISGTGAMLDYTTAASVPWYRHKDKIKSVVVENGITSISGYAFSEYTKLESITLSETVTSIGKYAFRSVTEITDIDLTHVSEFKEHAFDGCTGLTSLVLDSAKTIGEQAFLGCTELSSVSLGNSEKCVEIIGKRAFNNCPKLTNVSFVNVKEIGEYTFENSNLINADLSSVVTIGQNAFNNSLKLTTVTFGSGLTAIGEGAFSKTALSEVSILSNASIGNYAFSQCSNMKTATLADGIASIPNGCFSQNTGMEKVVLPASITAVGEYAFYNCNSLKNVEYAGTKEQWTSVNVGDNNDPLVALMGKTPVTVTGVSLDRTELDMILGGKTETLLATVIPENADNLAVTWKSSATDIATVDSNGYITAVAPGTATITVTTVDGGFEASCAVSVTSPTSEIGLDDFTFTVASTRVTDSRYQFENMSIVKQIDGSYCLIAPTYALGTTTYSSTITVTAPDGFDKAYSVSYTKYDTVSGDVIGTTTVNSQNGVAVLEGYYNSWGKNTGVYDPSAGFLREPECSDFVFTIDGNDKKVYLSLYNELRGITVTNQSNAEAVAPTITRNQDGTYSVTLNRGTEYKIAASGGIDRSNYTNSKVYIYPVGGAAGNSGSITYTPGEETTKDFTILIKNEESSYHIADKTYTLHVVVDEVVENSIKFEKYIVTINGTGASVEEGSSYWKVPTITQYDTVSIKAVISNLNSSAMFEWSQGLGRNKVILDETTQEITIDTSSTNIAMYIFSATVTSDGQSIQLPQLRIQKVNKRSIATPVILEQPIDANYFVGQTAAPLVVKVKSEAADTNSWHFDWYQCDDADGTNPKLIYEENLRLIAEDGNRYTQYTPTTAKAGELWFYCEVYQTGTSESGTSIESARVKSNCVKLTVSPEAPVWSGNGTAADPYLLNNQNDLNVLREKVNTGSSFDGMYFSFTTDIELSADWTPIGTTKDGTIDTKNGTNIYPFSGTLDGCNFTIKIASGGKPLFNIVRAATIKNLKIYGEKIEGFGLIDRYFVDYGDDGNYNTGCPVTATISNCHILSGTTIKRSGFLGGYASGANTVTISDCTIASNVTIGYGMEETYVDGFAMHTGSFAGDFNGVITNCTSAANVAGQGSVGGIVGRKGQSMGKFEIRNCSFNGTVNSTGNAGGILGSGYDDKTAPNSPCVTVENCKVSGKITGQGYVGGIIGREGEITQCWGNGVGGIGNNEFTGKVFGPEGKTGGIIGYMTSINVCNQIYNNYYAVDCGAANGIGTVKYIDTSCKTHETSSGTIYFDTSKELPNITGVEVKNLNRTDDPLGADKEKLCYTEKRTKAYVTELTISGTYKTEYLVGDKLDTTGIILTAKWSDGTTTNPSVKDAIITGFDSTEAGSGMVTLEYEGIMASFSINIKPKSQKITVSITVMGDSKHGDNSEIHGLARGGLTTWASASVEANTTETVWDVIQRVAESNNLSIQAVFTEKYNSYYIEAINGLGEFDNGKNSGWMYTVNGTHPNVGVSARYVKDHDVIILHYTDDYTYEQGEVNYGKPVGQVAAEAVDKLIEAIGTVSFTDACKDKIDAARKAYNALSESEKKLVKKLSTLEAAEKKYTELKKADDQKQATAVDNLIAAIGTVTKNSGTKINAAWNAYNALTADQKALVKKLATLQSATSTWNDLMAKEVIDLIDKIDDPVTESSEKAIKDARTAYDKLTNAQKKLVTNYEKLTKAETELAKLIATEDDKKKAQEVIDMIDKLGDITAESEKDVEAARKAYDALTDLQKKLVENYDKLEAAESKLKLLKAMGKVTDPYIATGDYMINLGTPSVGSIGGEWMVIGLLRADRNVPNLSDYYDSVLKYVEENIDENERLHSAKSTDNSRIILALTAMGKDVTKVGTHNLLAGLNSMDYIKKQGNNGPIWALIALDSGNYPVPEGDVTRQALIDEILRVQTSDGGWAISGDEADADMTGMALTALARYYKKDLRVLAAVDKAIECLSQMQDADGGFSTFSGNGGKVATSESTAQVVVALTALGINPDTDARFVKNGHSAIDALVSYFVNGGGFKHVSNGQLDGMATEQAYYALTAYYRFLEEKTSLYDMTDVIDMGGDPEEVVEETTEPTVPATTEPVEAENGGSFPWAIMVLVLAAGFGGGIATVTLILPRIKKKRF